MKKVDMATIRMLAAVERLSALSLFILLSLHAPCADVGFFVPLGEFLARAGLSVSDSIGSGGDLVSKEGSSSVIDDIASGGESYGSLQVAMTLRGDEGFCPSSGRDVAQFVGVGFKLAQQGR